MIISYVGISPPKCTCHDKQSHLSKYMILLECLYAQTHVSSPLRLPHTCLSQMRVKSQFSNKSFLFSKTYYRNSVNILDNPPRRICWVSFRKQFIGPSDVNWLTISQENSPENLMSKFLSQTVFTFLFIFVSCNHT